MSLLSKPELVKLAVEIAGEYDLDSALICAHIDVRTRWHSGFCVPSAISYLVHQNFPDPLEAEHRSIQWGLMAIGGEFARQEGFQSRLPDLLQPAVNLREGCRLFLKISGKYTDPIRATIDSLVNWNRENSRDFAAQTLSKLEAYRVLLARMPDQQQTFLCDGTTPRLTRLQSEGNLLLEVGESTHTQSLP